VNQIVQAGVGLHGNRRSIRPHPYAEAHGRTRQTGLVAGCGKAAGAQDFLSRRRRPRPGRRLRVRDNQQTLLGNSSVMTILAGSRSDMCVRDRHSEPVMQTYSPCPCSAPGSRVCNGHSDWRDACWTGYFPYLSVMRRCRQLSNGVFHGRSLLIGGRGRLPPPIEQRAGEPFGAEDERPILGRQVRGYDDRTTLMALGALA
jgi:hypothetical protein